MIRGLKEASLSLILCHSARAPLNGASSVAKNAIEGRIHGIDAACAVAFRSHPQATAYGIVRVDEYWSPNSSRKGTIVLLHGSTGLLSETPTRASLDNLGENYLACNGFRVFIPHYLDVSGLKSVLSISKMEHDGFKWVEVVLQVERLIKGTSPHESLFLYGQSLGGYIALRAAMYAPTPSGLSLLSAGLRLPDKLNLQNFPPVLLQHGKIDEVVPLAESERLYAQLPLSKGNRLIIYPSCGHNLFYGTNGEVTRTTAQFFSTLSRSSEP